jgi:5'-3' exonuclease
MGKDILQEKTLIKSQYPLSQKGLGRVDIYLIDGTYELFRHFFAVPAGADVHGREIGAVRGVLSSVLSMIAGGATYIGVATDHVVESFRNHLYPGYKTSEGVPRELLSQFPLLEEALQAMGVLVWPMVYYEADDALASAAAKAAKDDRVTRVVICTPDKDLSQCLVGTRVVQLDRRRDACLDGARRLRRLPCLSTLTLKIFRRTGGNGIHQSGKPARSPKRC